MKKNQKALLKKSKAILKQEKIDWENFANYKLLIAYCSLQIAN
jgi:hypothetical protein